MSRRSAGKKNQPPKHPQPKSGPMDASFNRGEAGKRRKPASKRKGKSKDLDQGYSEFDDISIS